jgi:hypothetical protein
LATVAWKRRAFLLGRLVEQGGRLMRIRRLGGTRSGAIRLTRFLRNEAVTVREMLTEAGSRAAARCVGRHVLAIQDTVLGLIDGQFLPRSAGRKAARHDTPIEHKESFRWLQDTDPAALVCAGVRQVTVMADREADLFEAFARRPEVADLLIRAAEDRSLEEGGRLFAWLDAWPATDMMCDSGRPHGRAPQTRYGKPGVRCHRKMPPALPVATATGSF